MNSRIADSPAMAVRGCKKKKKRNTERSPVSKLSDDLLVEIISRVPFKSTCCCKCVSTRWRDLVSHPDHRKKLPRSTLAGFIFLCYDVKRRPSYIQPGYLSVSGNWCARIDTSLSFFSRCETLDFWLDCCNGLLLCRRRRMHHDQMPIGYMVCNPATEKYVLVPATSWSRKVWLARLAFDPDVSSHFHVFEFAPESVLDANTHSSRIKAVRIYSSETGAWTHPLIWEDPLLLCSTKGVFSMGRLYSSSYEDYVVAVGLEGNCMSIRAPRSTLHDHNLYLSQGQLHILNKCASQLSIWALEDSNTDSWILKHNLSDLQLLGIEYSMFANDYKVISIHPESNVIFIVCGMGFSPPTKLMSFEMDSRKLSLICDIELGWKTPFLSYVPLFSESLAYGH